MFERIGAHNVKYKYMKCWVQLLIDEIEWHDGCRKNRKSWTSQSYFNMTIGRGPYTVLGISVSKFREKCVKHAIPHSLILYLVGILLVSLSVFLHFTCFYILSFPKRSRKQKVGNKRKEKGECASPSLRIIYSRTTA